MLANNTPINKQEKHTQIKK